MNLIKPPFPKIDSTNDSCFGDCQNEFYHTFEYKCEYAIKLTNKRHIELFNLTVSDKSVGLYELKKQLKIAGQNGFIYIQTNK